MMKLNETVEMMNSANYKERFKAEYDQLAIRYYGLKICLQNGMTEHSLSNRLVQEAYITCR